MEPECAYRYRCYPNATQQSVLARTFGAARYVYNWALRLRTDAFFERSERISYVQSSAQLTALKKAEGQEWMNEVSSVPMQQALRHLDAAYRNFFAGRTAYPTFRHKDGPQSAEYTTSGFAWRDGKITLAKTDAPLRVKWSRPLPLGSTPITITVSRDVADRYFVSIRIRVTHAPLPATDANVGVDLGITSLVTLSTGEKVGNPRFAARDAKRLAKAQRALSHKQKGCKRREKTKRRVARIHARIADRRQDTLYKLSTRLIRENQTIALESLAVKNMVRNHTLARAIHDAGWGEFVRQLRYKAEWYGRTLVEIDRWYPSSKRCHCCGHIVDSLPLDVRHWTCPQCGVAHDRDVNAAINIAAVGQTVFAQGETVRPKRETVAAGLVELRIPRL